MNREESPIKETFHTLVRKEFGDEVREVNSHYPSRLSVRFDWERINAFDEGLGEQFLENPEKQRDCVREAISCWDAVDMPEAIVRVHNLPESHRFRVGKQRTLHLGKLITVEGEVVQMDGVQPFAETAALECHRCGTVSHVPQAYGKMIEPAECMGCERSSDYKFLRAHSDLIHHRQVIIQRTDTNLDDDPPSLVVYLTQDLVDRIGPGDYVSLVGHYDTAMFQTKSVLQTYLDTWDIESHEEGVTADHFSPAEISELVMEEVEARQSEDPSSFGAIREDVVAAVVDEGVREKEVDAQVDELLDKKDIAEVGGGKLMIT